MRRVRVRPAATKFPRVFVLVDRSTGGDDGGVDLVQIIIGVGVDIDDDVDGSLGDGRDVGSGSCEGVDGTILRLHPELRVVTTSLVRPSNGLRRQALSLKQALSQSLVAVLQRVVRLTTLFQLPLGLLRSSPLGCKLVDTGTIPMGSRVVGARTRRRSAATRVRS